MYRTLLRPMWRRLPIGVRRSIRAIRLEYLVHKGVFDSEEPEFRRLSEWLGPGDTALDIGANFGSYTLRMSELVGDTGHVFSFEPVPQTFAMLTRALTTRGCINVCALNLACSNVNGYVTMSIPDDPLTGEDLYRASISKTGPALLRICGSRIDDLPLPLEELKVVKIDAEGHDAQVIDGMWTTISKLMPVLIIEHPSSELSRRLTGLGYSHSRQSASPNTVFVLPNQSRPAMVDGNP